MGALVRSSGFQVAFLSATAGSLVGVVTPGRIRSTVLGIAVTAGFIAGLIAEDVFTEAIAVAVVLIAVGAFISDHRSLAVRSIALVPGSALVATIAAEALPGGEIPVWGRALAFVTIACAAPSTTSFDRRFPHLTYALLAVSALGAYATVPDTEQALGFVGALIPVVMCALWRRYSGEPSGPSMCVAFLAWVALVGGQARPGSVVGAIGCLGVLALGPLARRANPVCLVVVHVATVVVASRVGGLRVSAWAAAAVVVPLLVVAALVLVACRRPGGRVGAL